MTDTDIIKALECCANNGDCEECAINPHHGNYGYCTSLAIKAALDLINRQKVEIDQFADIGKMYSEIKSEAIREFAQRLKKEAIAEFDYEGCVVGDCVDVEDIDNLVKEMTEGGNAHNN